MASKFGSVWAIDIGSNSLRAIRLTTNDNGDIEVVAFDNIEHGRILSGAGVKESEKKELIAISLRKFVEQNDLGKDALIISVPSQNSFARFVNLPPVVPKQIPELVRFEASQQIPFDINEVQWDWQLFEQPGSAEKKVGIFAIKNEVVNSLLEHFEAENLTVQAVQMAPMALYNYVVYDQAELADSNKQAIIALDIGAENTDLVVCTSQTVWQRCIPIGGNAFTRAIAEAFKITFDKAEKLKRTAPMSKYARQIYQAMRPVFTELASEIQRSINFYISSNNDTKMVKVIAFGGGTKMRGLLKYLRQTLQIPVERPESFKRIVIGAGVSAAKFHENCADFGVVYGLALQGLGLCKIESNLLPRSVARTMMWSAKAKYFAAAAFMILVVSVLGLVRSSYDSAAYGKTAEIRRNALRAIRQANEAEGRLNEQQQIYIASQEKIKKELGPLAYRDVVPLLYQTIVSQLPNAKTHPEQAGLYEDFAKGDIDAIKKIPRKERKMIFLTNFSATYYEDVNTAPLAETDYGGAYSAGLEARRQELKDRASDRIRREREMKSYPGGGSSYSYYEEAVPAGPQPKPGFVVTLIGYSPYGDVRALLDPVDVGSDRAKWGFVTRLARLNELGIFDGNSPFNLFSKDIKHFKPEIRDVDINDGRMPRVIGVVETIKDLVGGKFNENIADVLVDPMTGEVMSKAAKLDARRKPILDRLNKIEYEINDHWFTLKMKFVWERASTDAGQGQPEASTTSTTGG